MPWSGKLIAGILAYWLTAAVPGWLRLPLIGLAVLWGDRFDKARTGSARVRFASDGVDVQRVFFESTFRIMGHLAKADGRVSEQEIQVARNIMHQMRLGPEKVHEAIGLFSEGKEPGFTLDAQAKLLRSACGSQRLLIRSFLEIQFHLLLSKGSIHSAERDSLWRIAAELDISRAQLTQMEATMRARHSFRGGRQGQADPAQELAEAYKALGIESSATDKEVKTAYRQLMNQHHPDKLAAKGLPESMLEVAKQKAREINAAYGKIKEIRGVK